MINRRTLIRSVAFASSSLALKTAMTKVGASAQDSTFVIGSLEEPGSLSALVQLPHHFPSDVPQTLIFDSLTQFMPDGSVEPKLATSWDVSDDELTYTFNLNPDAVFHDGTPVTADDVVFTIEAIQNPETNSSNEGVETVVRAIAEDDHTVTIELDRVTPQFLAQGGARGIVPRHLLEDKDIATDEFNHNPVGSGPYKMVSYLPGESIVFEAVEDHYLGAPNVPRVEFRVIMDQNVILTQLMSGELSYALAAPRDMAALENANGLQIIEVETPRYFSMIPNYERSYWQDIEVRTAILSAIDREGILNGILMGHGSVIHSNITPASWAYTEDGVTFHTFDPEMAKGRLDAAGWEESDDGIRQKDDESLQFVVTLYSYDQTLQQAMLVAQQNLADIGVDMQVEMVEPGVFSSRRNDGTFDALARIWNPVYDPDQSILFKTGNWYGYGNELVDSLSDEGVSTSDREVRLPVYEELQRVFSEDLPHLWLYSENELHVLSSSVTGLESHPVNVFWDLPAWAVD